jgi:CRISPR system Cascade subunit CasC
MPRTILDIHVLQTVPPSNLNRDDTGSPKSAVYGGVRRARVSSQAWKRAIRRSFEQCLDRTQLGMRTKRVVEMVGDEIIAADRTLEDRAYALAEDVLKAAGIKIQPAKKKGDVELLPESGYLLFLSHRQIDALAAAAVSAARRAGDGAPSFEKKHVQTLANRQHSVDVSLFGRMVADVTDLNVDAAAQVAHALSVHGVANEYDYYTAVDDHKDADPEEHAGAGMIGTVEFNSSTLYRYATLDVDRLFDNLGATDAGPDATRRAVEAFVRAFVASMPTGKQNTFANRTLPDAVLIFARDTQSINLVGAFEQPVCDTEHGGRLAASIGRLAAYAKEVHTGYDETPVAAWTFGIGHRLAPLDTIAQRGSLDSTVSAIGQIVGARLAGAEPAG